MKFRVVCISRTLAAGGETIGRATAQRLGFRFVDDEIIRAAARTAQVDPETVAATEHKQPLLKRLIDALASAGSAAEDQAGAFPLSVASSVPSAFVHESGPAPYRALPDDLRNLIRATIHTVAEQGRVVIAAHAASMALGGANGVLRVLITASPETRARRLAVSDGGSERDAAASVASSDRERRDYFRRFYQIEEELPTHYDLVINTDVMSPEQAVSLIVSVAQS